MIHNYANRNSYTITVHFNIKLESIKVRNYVVVVVLGGSNKGLIVSGSDHRHSTNQPTNHRNIMIMNDGSSESLVDGECVLFWCGHWARD